MTRPRTNDWRLDNEQSCPILLPNSIFKKFSTSELVIPLDAGDFLALSEFLPESRDPFEMLYVNGVRAWSGMTIETWPLLWIRSPPGGFEFKDGQC